MKLKNSMGTEEAVLPETFPPADGSEASVINVRTGRGEEPEREGGAVTAGDPGGPGEQPAGTGDRAGAGGESSEANTGRPHRAPPAGARSSPAVPAVPGRDGCARGEGEPCGGGGAGRGHCAPGMECVKSRKRRKGKAGAAAGGPGVSGVCVCKSRYPVCGSDGVTYPSGCQLRAASLRAESRGEKAITQVSKGTCEQGPSIVTPPKDIWNVTGAQVYLSCEVIGIPTPVLIWNKVKRGHYGVQRTELLPGDRDNLAIQTRGGPEKHEVTGWVLVSPLSKEDAGEYECHASNSQGQASASAKITVVDALHEIPVQKGEGAEL
ncbi:PREDICTED: insulin-like growth factor-binding protein 7 [Ceratotherium simum simum]|uniref:Insulin-like growth factor-binding protein 7 n=1 Tax=Ceratotherium simum simum TaxID=73337 RepID=A0ABM0H449_CERSS|nr:PREDICTED: insulin-like growth factor-binding protein 7 [Ceratotherium simum simum]